MNAPHPQQSARSADGAAADAQQSRFSAAWAAGAPALAEWLHALPAAERESQLAELLSAELNERLRRGETIDPQRVAARFPEHQALALGVAQRCMGRGQDTVSFKQDAALATPAGRGGLLAVGGQFGKFTVLAWLGKGGFGEVYHCRDTHLQRDVALKLPRAGTLGPEEGDLFLREARAAAQLSHPGIVPVFEAGASEGRLYIASHYVAGETLRAALRNRKKWAPAEAAQLVARLASALHYAHLRGIIHRDVKPENVMLDANGEPRLMDFGLARRLEGETLRTQVGLQLGTPAYMSPEQAAGRSHLADARSDQWALGVMLYELLTGRRPFLGEVLELLPAIAAAEPPAPRSLAREIPLDLETIALKCLAKDPDQRYPSCQHLAEELQRWLQGDAILARPATWLETSVRFARKRPLTVTALFAAVLVASGATIYWQTRPAYLDVRVSPATAAVVVDGAALPLSEGRGVATFAPGRRKVTASATGYTPIEREVNLVRGSANTSVLQLELRSQHGYVQATSDPPGAEVQLRDAAGQVVARGVTPFNSPRVPSGSYQLALSKPLFADTEATAVAPDGDRVGELVTVKLQPTVTGGSSYDQLLKAVQLLDRPLKKPIVATDQPLKEVITQVSLQEELPITLSVRGLEEAGVRETLPITINTSAKTTLRELFRDLLTPLQLSLAPELRESGLSLSVTSRARESRQMWVVVYPVADINSVKQGDFDSLLQQIQSSISPASWSENGGIGSIEVNREPPALVISQVLDVHFDLLKLLQSLKANDATAKTVPKKPPPSRPAPQPPQALIALKLVNDDPPETPVDFAWREELAALPAGIPATDERVSALRERGLALWREKAGTAAGAEVAAQLSQLRWPLDEVAATLPPLTSGFTQVVRWPPKSPAGGNPLCVALSPDQRWLAAGYPNRVELLEQATGKLVRTVPANDRVVRVAFRHDSQQLLVQTGRWAAPFRFLIPDGEPEHFTKGNGSEFPGEFSRDGQRWLTQHESHPPGFNRTCTVSLGAENQLSRGIASNFWPFSLMRFAPDENVVWLVNYSGLTWINLSERAGPGQVKYLPGVQAAAVSSHGDWVATLFVKPATSRAPAIGDLQLRHSDQLQLSAQRLELPPKDTQGWLAASWDGRRLAFLGRAGQLRVWEVDLSREAATTSPAVAPAAAPANAATEQPALPPAAETALPQFMINYMVHDRVRLEFTGDGRHLLLEPNVGCWVIRLPDPGATSAPSPAAAPPAPGARNP